MTKAKVKVSDADREKGYFKYYLRNSAQVSPEKLGRALAGPIQPGQALTFALRREMTAQGYADDTVGYCVMPDGTGYVADHTFLPGIKAEMVDWWFAWRGLDPLRYIIADPEANLSALTMQSGKAVDPDLTVRERYWDTTQTVVRLGDMGPETEFWNFKCPSDVGFDLDQAVSDNQTLVCVRCYGEGFPPFAAPDYFISFLIRNTEGGAEVFSRYWLGWSVRYSRDYKALPDGFFMPPMNPMGVLIQDMKMWANLAEILPGLYAEEKNNV